ncbi:hypothetical protein BDD12DRAFT_508326 [Trichophaea hybrida]|nr:hypothetical protein BDD12DRAFT_508326 [Trichophaea hybrida]
MLFMACLGRNPRLDYPRSDRVPQRWTRCRSRCRSSSPRLSSTFPNRFISIRVSIPRSSSRTCTDILLTIMHRLWRFLPRRISVEGTRCFLIVGGGLFLKKFVLHDDTFAFFFSFRYFLRVPFISFFLCSCGRPFFLKRLGESNTRSSWWSFFLLWDEFQTARDSLLDEGYV